MSNASSDFGKSITYMVEYSPEIVTAIMNNSVDMQELVSELFENIKIIYQIILLLFRVYAVT